MKTDVKNKQTKNQQYNHRWIGEIHHIQTHTHTNTHAHTYTCTDSPQCLHTHLFTVAGKKCISGVGVRREIRSAWEIEGGWCALTQWVWWGGVIPLGVTTVEATAGHTTGHIAVLLAGFKHWFTWGWGNQRES